MKKKRNFSLIELIVAFSLVSIAISFLFVSLRNFSVLNVKINRYLPEIIQTEKSYFYLKDLIQRIHTDFSHPIEYEKNSFFSFYFTPTIFDEDGTPLFFAKCFFFDSELKIEIYKPQEDKMELLSSTVLLKQVQKLQLVKDTNPEVIFIEYTTQNEKGSWIFFLDPYQMLKNQKAVA